MLYLSFYYNLDEINVLSFYSQWLLVGEIDLWL